MITLLETGAGAASFVTLPKKVFRALPLPMKLYWSLMQRPPGRCSQLPGPSISALVFPLASPGSRSTTLLIYRPLISPQFPTYAWRNHEKSTNCAHHVSISILHSLNHVESLILVVKSLQINRR